MEEYLKAAEKAALEAGKLALEMASTIDVSTKASASDLVTNADIAAENTITERLSEFSETGFIGEEKGISGKEKKLKWVIDPIDGTTNYVSKLPFFCTSIALATEEEPVLGVIFEPNRKELFSALQGKGAFLNHKKMQVSETTSLQNAVVALNAPSGDKIAGKPYFENSTQKDFYLATRALRKFGAVALELAYLACGRLDSVFHPGMKPWDGAAGTALVREAGGRVTGKTGNEWKINDKFFLASNSKLHSELEKLLKK